MCLDLRVAAAHMIAVARPDVVCSAAASRGHHRAPQERRHDMSHIEHSMCCIMTSLLGSTLDENVPSAHVDLVLLSSRHET